MAELGRDPTFVCAAEALVDGGDGVRFFVVTDGIRAPAFAVRYRGRAYAYINRCAHLAVELDWQAGRFFDVDGASLVCATHGARYHPHTGACAGGRCNGNGLRAVPIMERNNEIRLVGNNEFTITD